MYASLWRVLPGPIWLKIIIALVLIAVIVYALITWVFPWIDAMITSNEEGTVAT